MPPYSPDDLDLDLRWWAAANYLTVGQIYLRENALLREPLTLDHVKPRLLGHWGTSPGLSMLYALLNRVIRETDSDWLYVTGPGHGGPALVAAAWLEGTYSEVYPHVSDDADGVRTLFRQFSSPGGVPSHVSVQTPGQHPRGRRARLRAGPRGRCGVRQPGPHRRLRRRRRRGRDRAAVGVVAAAGLPQPAPRRRGAADPAPQRLQDRRAHGARADLGRGRGGLPAQPGLGPRRRRRATTRARSSRPCTPPCAPPTTGSARSRGAARRGSPTPSSRGRRSCCAPRRAGPARTSSTASRCRARSAPTRCRCRASPRTPSTCAMLEEWLRSYAPETLFDDDGRLVPGAAGPGARGRPPDVGDAVRQRRPAARGPAGAGPSAKYEVRGRGARRRMVEQHGVRRAS